MTVVELPGALLRRLDRFRPRTALELLSSERTDDGVWHAVYPTATVTLCGVRVGPDRKGGHRYPPTCGRCSKTARRFDRIDGSMPDFWREAA